MSSELDVQVFFGRLEALTHAGILYRIVSTARGVDQAEQPTSRFPNENSKMKAKPEHETTHIRHGAQVRKKAHDTDFATMGRDEERVLNPRGRRSS